MVVGEVNSLLAIFTPEASADSKSKPLAAAAAMLRREEGWGWAIHWFRRQRRAFRPRADLESMIARTWEQRSVMGEKKDGTIEGNWRCEAEFTAFSVETSAVSSRSPMDRR